MIKVFQLIRSIHLGGAEMVAFSIAEHCAKSPMAQFDFVIAELHSSNDDYSVNKKAELRSKNIRTISLGTSSKNISLLIGPFVLIYQIFKERPDIIHAHTDLPDLLLSNTARFFSFFHLKMPKIVRTIHNTELWPTHFDLGKYVEKSFNTDYVVGVSDAALNAYKSLRNSYMLPLSPHTQVIFNGCKLPTKANHQFKVTNGKINIAFCGRFENQKGVDILIKRIRAVNAKFKDAFVFHLIGSGTYYNDIMALASEYSNVLVYDAVSEISDKLHDFDFMIMPSRFEGLVLISLEASLSRVPVIAAYAPGLSETLPSDWPLQFNLENEEELLTIFENIYNNAYPLDDLKEIVFEFVVKNFSHKGMIDAYSQLYLNITN